MQIITDEIDYLKYLQEAGDSPIRPASDWREGVKQRLNGEQEQIGDRMPWGKTHKFVLLRPGEVSVWAGINGHGKSQILGQVSSWCMKGSKWLIASMEMKPEASLARMARQVAGAAHPSGDWIDRMIDWTDSRLWIYDQIDTVASDRILGMVHYAAQELGINHIVIDSLMKCGIGPDDYAKQKAFVDRLCWAAKAEDIHIHLVHHIRKGEKEGKIPDKFDIKGAGEITDLVDNVFIVHRNKEKEKKARMIESGPEDQATKAAKLEELAPQPDTQLICAKQRHGEFEGAFSLWFHPASQQFTPTKENVPMPLALG